MTISLNDCAALTEDDGAATMLHAILSGELDPCEVDACDAWVRRCYHPPSLVEQQMSAGNALIGGHGVEAILTEGSFGNVLMTYVNTGDTYAPTLVHDFEQGFIVTSWGDWVEAYEAETGERLP